MTESTEQSHRILVMIVDDHPAVRQGLRVLLEPEGIKVCAEAENLTSTIKLLDDHRPDVVLVDLSLGAEDGLSLIRELCGKGYISLVYSMHEDSRHIERAFAAGALGYVTKTEFSDILVDAVKKVALKQQFISPKTAAVLADSRAIKKVQERFDRLSDQEQNVYNFLGKLHSVSEVALAMNLSTRTVESYCARIMVKLELSGMHELRRSAVAHQFNHPE